jgi:hypothetical protein
MMNKKMIISGILLVLLSAVSFAGKDVVLAPQQAGDLVAAEVVADTALATSKRPVSHEAVSVSWALKPEDELAPAPKVHQAVSMDYWLQVDAADFDRGVELSVSAPEALVRISPLNRKDRAPAMLDLVLVNEQGRSYSQGGGVVPLLEPQSDAAQKTPFPEGTSIFRINGEVGTGAVLLFADGMDYSSGKRYLVHVREADSSVALHAATERDTYLAGQTLKVRADLVDEDGQPRIEDMTGTVISPSGRQWTLSFKDGSASLPLDAAEPTGLMSGLWEARIQVRGSTADGLVRRDVRTAFAVTQPTARYTGRVELQRDARALSAKLALEVGTPGRYEARGILFGTDEQGELRPLAVGQSAAWLEPGTGELVLGFETEHLEGSLLSAPYQVKDLRLIHQDRMSLIHRQADGFAVDLD